MNEPHSEETIVVEALRLPPAERSAYLDQATGGNMALRQRVESLLTSYQAGDFLEQAAAPVVRQTIVLSTPLTERAGDKIGRYKLLQQIGEGGCGVVYMAEQEEPVRRRVALKIIKAGMDTKSVIARFEAERQALALMDHPNIAKVLDAGATEAGRPYFVMELVRGMKITDYCDEAKLPFRARLDLFMQVCHAIQHAHQKGIIHRDIKPSNILVTINDGVPVPKVIDFGIAKATGGQQLTDKTIFTAFEQFIGTPAYMSPEQAMLTSLDIDSRSDIYSLGVLLYELLTGKTPFDAHELLAIGLDEMRRTIREKEPERPSTRLSTLPDKELTTTAQSRGLNAPKLVSELRGDLDWIVMKALEKDRARRYETANGLAADIQRHLLNEPVVACPPSTIYRFQKLVRRNKLAFAATATVFVSLTLGLTVSAILFFKERAARRHADEQAAIAQAISDFLQNDLLGQAKTSEQAQEGIPVDPNLTVRQAVDRAGARLDGRFTNQPLVEASIRSTLADVYDELNEMEASRSHAQRAFDLRRRILGPQDPLTIQVMMLLRDPDPAKQVALKERALELAKHVFGSNDTLSLRCMNDLGKAYRSMGRFDKALPLLEQSVKLHKAKFGPQSGETLWTLHYLGVAYVAAGRKDLAAPLLEENFRLLKNMFGPDHPLTLADMGELACAYEGVDRMDDALRLMEECVQLYKTKLGPENPATLSSMNFLGMLYAEAGRRSDALPLLEVLKVWQAKLSPDNPERPQTMFNLAVAYENTGQTDKALPLLEEALKIRKLKFGSDNPVTLQTMNELGVAYDNARRSSDAVPLLEEALKIRKLKFGFDNPDTLQTMNDLGAAYGNAGRLSDAVPLLEETLKRRQAKLGSDHPATLHTMRNLAGAYENASRQGDALPLYEEAFKLAKTKLGPASSITQDIARNLARVYEKANRIADTQRVFDEILITSFIRDQRSSDLLWARARFFARHGRWDAAAADLRRVIDFHQDDAMAWHSLAALVVQTGQIDRYHEHCAKCLQLFSTTKDPTTAERIAKDCLILPSSGADPQAVAKLADFAASIPKSDSLWAWFQLCKSLSEYRSGRFANAEESAQLALSKAGDAFDRDAAAQVVLAMAQWQLKQTGAARSALAQAEGIADTRMPKMQDGSLGDHWLDWIIAQALLREARTLIEGSPETRAQAK